MAKPQTMKDLFHSIQCLEEYFKGYPNESSEKELQKIKEEIEDKQTYQIVIVANMSAGKSTLINALFGEELLPSFSEATSDCIVEITSMPEIPKEAEVFFEDKSHIKLDESNLVELKKYAQKDSKCEEEKYHKVECIKLSYPFQNIKNQQSEQNDIEILFVDTPGPNNTGDYNVKHKNQTITKLTDAKVDMALFVFDYDQLDDTANDEQGLWHTIKTRRENDKNFEVFFLLNKIDRAFDDNEGLIERNSSQDEQELMKKYWNKHEEEAIKKLEEAAKNHGIKEPKVFAISSLYGLLQRIENQGRKLKSSEKDKIRSFKKRFQEVFGEECEWKMLDYIGLEKLESAMNKYIEKQVLQKIITKYSDRIQEILREEHDAIRNNVETLSKPKAEAERNIKNALEFLKKELPPITEKTQENITNSKEETKEKVKSTINKWIQKEFTDKVEKIVLKTMIFAHTFVKGVKNPAQQVEHIAKDMAEEEKKHFFTNKITQDFRDKEEAQTFQSNIEQYTHSLIENCKNNFIAIQSEINSCYGTLNANYNTILQTFKQQIEEGLNQSLEIDTQEQMQPVEIDYSTVANLSISVPKSALSYHFEEAQYEEVSDSTWYIPWSWFSTKRVKTKDEEHNISINPKEFKNAIRQMFNKATENLRNLEIKRHQEAIECFGNDTIQEAITGITEGKEQEIKQLEKDIKNAKEMLENKQKQQEVLTSTREKMGF